MTSSVRVVYDYHYSTVEGQPVHIHIGDQFQLLNKTSDTWWHVRRGSGQVPFYVPANCVEEVLDRVASVTGPRRGVSKSDSSLDRMRASSAYDEPSADYSSDTTGSDEERGECFDNPVYALPSVVVEHVQHVNNGRENVHGSTRSLYPEYVNIRTALNCSPPVPGPEETPVRTLEDWEEFEDNLGRSYYYHPRTNISSWKPPRKLMHLHSEPDCTSDPSPKVDSASSMLDPAQLRFQEDPTQCKDYRETYTAPSTCAPLPPPPPPSGTNSMAVVEMETRVTAVIYSDLPPSPSPLPNSVLHGRHVNFLHRLNRTSSLMEDVNVEEIKEASDADNEKENKEKIKSASLPMPPKRAPPSKDFNELRQLIANKMSMPERSVRARSTLVLSEAHLMEFEKMGPKTGAMRNSKTLPSMVMGKTWKSDKLRHRFLATLDDVFNWPMQNGVLQGFLNITKFSENGRRIKKEWSPAFVVLMDTTLFVFKPPLDLNKSPEITVDLPGATIKWAKEKSNRKNVFEIAAADGSQILVQDDNRATSLDWVNCIMQTLARLPPDDLAPIKVLPANSDPSKPERPLSPRISRLLSRTRSTKIRPDGQPGLPEDLEPPSPTPTSKKKKSTDEMENSDIKVKKMKIIERLKNFFSRRPTLESLKAKGIIRDGPVFGCNFIKLCEHEQSNVPNFVKRCIAAIEKKDMRTDGIYRVSGNLSQVQKLRFQIDQDKYSGMETEEDVNVLTGLLKLFFRELKEPMIPFNLYDALMKANKIPDKTARDRRFKELVNQIPAPNSETLRYLFQHLHRVAQHGDHNRMRLPNLAIVFGPTLMWPETPSMNLATDMLCQNQVVEHLLLNFHALFDIGALG